MVLQADLCSWYVQLARDIVGRMMADPAFIHKLAIEETLTICTALVWEVRQRRERFVKELDFVAINTVSLAAATGALVWLMAPNRASGVLKVCPVSLLFVLSWNISCCVLRSCALLLHVFRIVPHCETQAEHKWCSACIVSLLILHYCR